MAVPGIVYLHWDSSKKVPKVPKDCGYGRESNACNANEHLAGD